MVPFGLQGLGSTNFHLSGKAGFTRRSRRKAKTPSTLQPGEAYCAATTLVSFRPRQPEHHLQLVGKLRHSTHSLARGRVGQQKWRSSCPGSFSSGLLLMLYTRSSFSLTSKVRLSLLCVISASAPSAMWIPSSSLSLGFPSHRVTSRQSFSAHMWCARHHKDSNFSLSSLTVPASCVSVHGCPQMVRLTSCIHLSVQSQEIRWATSYSCVSHSKLCLPSVSSLLRSSCTLYFSMTLPRAPLYPLVHHVPGSLHLRC